MKYQNHHSFHDFYSWWGWGIKHPFPPLPPPKEEGIGLTTLSKNLNFIYALNLVPKPVRFLSLSVSL